MVRSYLSLAATVLMASLPSCCRGHRTIPEGATCSSQFYTPDTALAIPNPTVSWATYRIFTCDEPIFWLEAEANENQTLAFTVTVPVIERFQDVRISVAWFGPSLPPFPEGVVVPDEIREYSNQTATGVALFQSPQNQTTCDHLTADAMKGESTVVDDRCLFYERFGGSNSWVVLDQEIVAAAAGLHKIAVYVEGGTTAKAAFACCDWPEDFVTNYPMPEPDCPFCGTSATDNPAWSSHFYEQKSMTAYAGFPPAASCDDPDALNLEPSEEQCPPPLDDSEEEAQPSSCDLGCDSEGECHSHNVFGDCTHVLDWSLEPKFGDAPVSNVVIFKGDKIRFDSPGDLAHNLFEMADAPALDSCDFMGATVVASVEEVFIGHTITFDEAGTFHFSCGISCTGFPVDGESQTRIEDGDAALCHCNIGQKLTVEVKDSSEGLRCHDHEQASTEEAAPLVCLDGELVGRAIDNPAYGAMDETECAELCAQSVALQFMPGVEMGTCSEKGYTANAIRKIVTIAGSPQDVEVRITSNAEASTCHCHSYEQIACPEDETPDDTLYYEHIDEIEQFCTGILDGSEEACPYKCFQPMEVLHLHYLECGSRELDPTYLAVNVTQKCHIAAAAPADADCPEVTLGERAGAANSGALYTGASAVLGTFVSIVALSILAI